MNVDFTCNHASVDLAARALDGIEEVGRPTQLSLDLIAAEPLSDPAGLVGEACALRLSSALGVRTIHGVVRSITRVVSADPTGARSYRVVMTSTLARLELRKDCRIVQHLSAPEIVSQLCTEGGAGTPTTELGQAHPALRHVTQYGETHLTFVRRLCERDGFWYRFEPHDDHDSVVLCDDAAAAPWSALDAPLMLTEEAGLGAEVARAWHLEIGRERAAGAVAAAGYDFRHPALAVGGDAVAGHDSERASRIYCVAPEARTPEEARRVASIALEAARARTSTLAFETSAFVLCPGKRFELVAATDHLGPAPERELFCVRIEHTWRWGTPYHCRVTATPARLPFRLEQRTPRPKISGVQSAIVTGPPGEGIFTDADGCVRLRFHWDRFGATDDGSSMPVRVVHPNLAGSMLIPRVGWEVWVAFEEGDPDRPFVIGRAYNGKHRPPVALPANKTMTVLSTSSGLGAAATRSSLGAAAINAVSFDDAAGRQGFNWNAGLGLTKTIGGNATIQTLADEKVSIQGSQTLSVGGNQTEAIHQARVVSTPVQTISVGGSHDVKTPAAAHTKAGAETVSCAVLMEKVGSPGGALGDLAKQAGMTVGGMIPVVDKLLAVGKIAYDAYSAYDKGGERGAVRAIVRGLFGLVPVVGEGLDVVEAGEHGPWQQKAKKTAKREASGSEQNNQVGGAAAASSGDAAGGGGGNRIHEIGGGAVEAIGGAYAIATGGQSKWTTLGASSIAVGGPHVTTAVKASWLVGGASVHNTGAYAVSATNIARDVRALQTNAASYTVTASGGIKIEASAVNLTCGALAITGKLVLDAGGTKVIVDGSGLTVVGADVSFEGPVLCAQSNRS